LDRGKDNDCDLEVDLRDRAEVISALDGKQFHWIFNLAGDIDHTIEWERQREIIEQHYMGVVNLVEATWHNRPRKFISIGSADEYGEAEGRLAEDLREGSIAPYSAAKAAATHYLEMLIRRERYPACVARFFLVYGPGQSSNRLIPAACETLLKGGDFETTEGRQLRDFLYVDDAVSGLLSLAQAPGSARGTFNIASGEGVPVRRVLVALQRLIPTGRVIFGARPAREGEPSAQFADVSKIRRETGWSPRFTLAEGLKRTASHFRGFLV
jgi:nucleoside-diphosphate-sugar epimerase